MGLELTSGEPIRGARFEQFEATVQYARRARWTSRHGAGVLRCDVPADATGTLVSFGALGHGIARDDHAAHFATDGGPPP
jgi:hypothetical protein